MKPIHFLVGLIFFCSNSFATTNVISATVSGHWSVSGSPYLIYDSIAIPAGQTLIIDPGVDVIFQGPYALSVIGELVAVGTENEQINFHAADTTGWGTDTGTVGGWTGIYFSIANFGDTLSKFQYCNIYDMKQGALTMKARIISIKNCNFFHNRYDYGAALSFEGYSWNNFGTCNLENCMMHDNRVYENTCGMALNWDFKINNCQFFNNRTTNGGPATTLYLAISNGEVFDNSFHDNVCGVGGSIIRYNNGVSNYTIRQGHITIAGNTIYHNTSPNGSAINCGSGFVDINSNFICNNTMTQATNCGFTEGSASIDINASAYFTDSTFYIIRNNVIANNYSDFCAAGVYAIYCSAAIVNNSFINNSSKAHSTTIFVYNDSNTVSVKNNIFYGNSYISGTPFSSNDIAVNKSQYFLFENNWVQKNYTTNVLGNLYTLIGDTSTNYVGSIPFFISATGSIDTAEDAMNADFSLYSISPCVDRGDTVGAHPDSTDIAGKPRIYNQKIDMGAYEYQPPNNPDDISTIGTNPMFQCYPNPTSGKLFITSTCSNSQMILRDLIGNTIMKRNNIPMQTSIDLDQLAPGTYLLTVINKTGAQATQKVTLW